jgi:serine/threonine-protein kinase
MGGASGAKRGNAVRLVPKANAAAVIGVQDRRYEIGKLISQGGMGTVHLGRRLGPLGFSKRVAIKSLRANQAANPTVRDMFIDEARLTAHLNHANIASTLDVLVEQDAVYLVMEYIEGRSLADMSKAARTLGRRIPIDVACAIAHDVLVGLDHAHDARDERLGPLGIVHCDVSPQNVRVGTDGLTRILDFGIARAANAATTTTRVNTLHGKLPYMAPEQLQNAAVDRRTDVYAVGVILWEMLAGSRLFQAATPIAIASEVLSGRVRRPSEVAKRIPAELDAIVMKALQRDARDRFATAREMADRLAKAVPLASRARVADALNDLRPSEYTPVTGIRAVSRAALPPPPSAVRAILLSLVPFTPTRANVVSAVLGVLGLGLLGLSLGAVSRRGALPPAAASQVQVVRSDRPVETAAPTMPASTAPPAILAPAPTAEPAPAGHAAQLQRPARSGRAPGKSRASQNRH